MNEDELLARLDELRAELRVRDRPERRAWNRLEPTSAGWTTRLYDDEAFELWNRVLRRFPGDLSAVHHLAIMHHARAIDAEQSEHPSRSDDDWRQALAYWHRLVEADEFWSEFSRRVDATPDPMPQVRRDLAERLLRVHFDVALDERSPHHRARFHVRLALDSPFPRDLVEGVRVNAYERAIADLDAVVWGPNTIEPAVLGPAIETVAHHLERDDDCATALNDLLRLLTRLQVGQIQEANGATDPDARSRALDELRLTARRYDGHVSRLEGVLLDAGDDGDQPAIADLAAWHSRAGQACNARDAYEEAAGHYRRAHRAALVAADPGVDDLHAEWLVSTVLAAREHAKDSPELARRLLASVDRSKRLPALGLVIRAQTWIGLGVLSRAERDVADAMSALESPREQGHVQWNDDPDHLRAECRKLRDHIRQLRLAKRVEPYMKKAEAAMAASRWAQAVEALDVLLATDEDYLPALVWRAQCHIERRDPAAADRDLGRAQRLARAAGDQQALETVRQVGNVVARLRQEAAAHGGPEAFRLHQEGITAFNDGRHERAIQLLRRARAAAGPGSARKLDKDLAHCLNDAAYALVRPSLQGIENGIYGPLGAAYHLRQHGPGPAVDIVRAQQMLEEAYGLHQTPVIEQNLAVVTQLRDRLMGRW